MPDEPLPLSALSERSIRHAAIHMGGRDPIVRDVSYGGPGDDTDRRLILDAGTLRAMLAVAEQSPTNRAVIHFFGVRVRQHRASNGHLYEMAYLVGTAPQAESSALAASARAGGPMTISLPPKGGG